jgi:DNA-binding response OmpR family regulator
MDGPQFCRELAARWGRDDTAIVVMTASDRAAHFRAVCAADDVLPKPFNIDALLATIARHLPPPDIAPN